MRGIKKTAICNLKFGWGFENDFNQKDVAKLWAIMIDVKPHIVGLLIESTRLSFTADCFNLDQLSYLIKVQ